MNQGVMSGELRPPILKFSFQNPFPVTENDIVHCVLILQGVMFGGLCSPIVLVILYECYVFRYCSLSYYYPRIVLPLFYFMFS